MTSANGTSKYYNKEKAAYCYIGEEKPNHDIVIIGWDDNYPKENFLADIESNGAFICQSSWGDKFGENGIFYVENCAWLDDIMNRVDPDDYESLQYFERTLRQSGIIDALEKAGVKEGDTVSVCGVEFDYVP